MKTVNNLVDLLLYYITSLYSAEEQIEQFIPSLLQKANHSSLTNALEHHAKLTNLQKQRLLQIPALIKEKIAGADVACINENSVAVVSKGMQGLLEEVRDLLQINLSIEITDAAIIGLVQKIEHYEICNYGTALAYAKQLKLHAVESLLNETLQEEYEADDLLTALATAAINKEGIPKGLQIDETMNRHVSDEIGEEGDDGDQNSVSITERTIKSPGGRAGTSHRGYGNGESRGH
jgi:ferritin-like metal-binding protein YciE